MRCVAVFVAVLIICGGAACIGELFEFSDCMFTLFAQPSSFHVSTTPGWSLHLNVTVIVAVVVSIFDAGIDRPKHAPK